MFWLMIGHCGGLRESRAIGDYVLAHAYLRDDHVLDAVLPPDTFRSRSIAEVQRALYDATKQVSGMPGEGGEAAAAYRNGGHHRRP